MESMDDWSASWEYIHHKISVILHSEAQLIGEGRMKYTSLTTFGVWEYPSRIEVHNKQNFARTGLPSYLNIIMPGRTGLSSYLNIIMPGLVCRTYT